jgi:hypothetical protein
MTNTFWDDLLGLIIALLAPRGQKLTFDMKKMIFCVAVMINVNLVAQDSTLQELNTKTFTITGYVEAYYSYDLNKPGNNMRPGFIYNFNRHNEFNLNLAFVKASYLTQRVRANVAIAVGTYMNSNYAAEPGTLKNIYEANAGYKLSARKNIWLDIGIIPSHIGFESAIGKDNWTLTRSLVAENSPYFETGAKLAYGSDNGKLILTVLALNGWQRITRVDGNSLLSFGTQIFFKPSNKVTLNYSTFFGTDKPDSARLLRDYHNVYGIFQFTPVIAFTAGFDIGSEESSQSGGDNNTWYTPVVILRVTPDTKWAVALRAEYFSDNNGTIIRTGTPNGFKTFGGSLNIDYLPLSNVALRLEGRYFDSKDAIFSKNGTLSDNNAAITFSTAIAF